MVKEIDISKTVEEAKYIFNNGLACSESVIYAVKKNFELDLPDEVIAMGSGFPWGLGRAYCICGALAGGTMCLGYFFGRTTPGDPKINKCFDITKEFHDAFVEFADAPCCGKITEGLDRENNGHKLRCTEIVGKATEKVCEIVCRELDIVMK
ncbi:MAG: C-GCAxxG-C-C family (seleno)protein [Terrisporobacter sp.]|uniref:C-GCAxxG-C-C family (seleno)protein n=1 Tax=Terrisporobacter sp. TaxID=1965305 RepID=UPI002FC8A973